MLKGVRRSYQISIIINGIQFNELVIDPHFEEKHQKSMDDEIILNLVSNLGGGEFEPIVVDRDGFRYF